MDTVLYKYIEWTQKRTIKVRRGLYGRWWCDEKMRCERALSVFGARPPAIRFVRTTKVRNGPCWWNSRSSNTTVSSSSSVRVGSLRCKVVEVVDDEEWKKKNTTEVWEGKFHFIAAYVTSRRRAQDLESDCAHSISWIMDYNAWYSEFTTSRLY